MSRLLVWILRLGLWEEEKLHRVESRRRRHLLLRVRSRRCRGIRGNRFASSYHFAKSQRSSQCRVSHPNSPVPIFQPAPQSIEIGADSLEIINTVHPLGFLLRKHKAAERRFELLPARAMRHAPQAWAIPVYLARFFIECPFLLSFLLPFLKRFRFYGASLPI